MISPKEPRACAFTLVEILVSVAVVATLMMLSLTALHRVRETRSNAQCVSRLRATSAAVHLLAAENNGIFKTWVRGDNIPGSHIWGNLLFMRGYTTKEMLRCPEAEDLYALDNGAWYRNTYGFNMIDADGHKLQPKGGGQEYELRFPSVASPSKHIILADSASLAFIRPGVRSETFRVNIDKSTEGVQLRHFGRVNVAFMDGHIEALDRTKAIDYFDESVIYERNQ